jgi:Fic family protein
MKYAIVCWLLKVTAMNVDDFRKSITGRLVPTIENCWAFVPNPLPPPGLNLANLALPLSTAMHALGELSGIGRTLPNPQLLIGPFTRVEAVASSKIEGTVTSAPELLMLELNPDAPRIRSDTREVNNYSKALRHGLKRIEDFPLSSRMLNELHAILMEGVASDRGARIIPGELKKTQNWIGARTIQNARFVPPPPSESLDALSDLEKFINRPNEDIPLLIKIALIHYQFEAIHPYPDGNGRVGRLIIPLMLCEQRAMSQPLLYLSSFFEQNYDKYIDTMFEVSRTGAWGEWIAFFLRGVEVAAKSALERARALQDLRENYLERIRSARTSALLAKVVDSLFAIPAITVPYAVNELGISYNAAKNNLAKLVNLGILESDDGNDRPQWYFAYEIIEIVNRQDSPSG